LVLSLLPHDANTAGAILPLAEHRAGLKGRGARGNF